MKYQLYLLFFVLLLLPNAFAVIQQNSMKVFAVTSDDEIALSADLILQIKPGSGEVWSNVEPLIGTSTQTTEKIAVQVARNYFDRVGEYDYFFDINSTASLVDGPSAGAAMTLLAISMLQNKEVPRGVSLTGTITVDGSIGAVGGVFKKAQEAARIGMHLFMIPEGEASQIVKLPDGVRSINLTEYAKKEWGLTVVEVDNIDTALKYAFSNIESIDVNVGKEFTPEFVPESIAHAPSLNPMAALTSDYISRGEMALNEARSALSGTLLTDPELIDAMLSLLNESEKTLKQATLLYDQNYLYSAANYAFLAKVNAALVKDISDDPSILESTSAVWDVKLLNLKKDLEAIKRDLNSFIPLDYLEWHIAAKERASWAEEKLDKLRAESGTIVITIGGNGDESATLEKLLDFEYASAWLEAARDFYSITADSKKRVGADSHFNNLLDSYLVNVESALTVLSEDEKEDALRRFDAAKIAKEDGWTISALYDAASALALSNASIYVKNRNLEELEPYLKSKISALQEAMQSDGHAFVWAQLYLDHAVYYSGATDFYKGQRENMQALEMAKSGISLVFLAENIFNVSKEFYSYFESIPEERYIQAAEPQGLEFMSGMIYLTILLLLLAVVALIILVLLLRLSKKMKEFRHYSLDERIRNIRKMQDALDRKWEQKKLSEQQYEEMNRRYHKELENLLYEKSEVSHLIIDLDRSKALLSAFEHALTELKKRKEKGLILKEDYQNSLDYYNKQIASLKRAIAEEKQHIASDEKQPIMLEEEKPAKGKKPVEQPKEEKQAEEKPLPEERAEQEMIKKEKPARKRKRKTQKVRSKKESDEISP